MFKNKTIKINRRIRDRIVEYYISAKLYKYQHTYDWSEVYQDIIKAYNDRNFTPYHSTKQDWIDNNYCVVANKRNWIWAYREKDNTVYFEDIEKDKNLPISLSPSVKIQNHVSYQATKKQPYSKYGLTVVQSKLKGKDIFNIQYHDSIISSDPITIIKDMGKKEPYGKYKLIAYCCIGGMMYGLSSDGKLYNSNRSWKDCYTESLLTPHNCSLLITEQIENLKADRLCEEMMNRFYSTLRYLIYS